MSAFFIHRPVFAGVIAIIIVHRRPGRGEAARRRAVSGDRAADGADHHLLPGRERRDAVARPWPRRSRSSSRAWRSSPTSARPPRRTARCRSPPPSSPAPTSTRRCSTSTTACRSRCRACPTRCAATASSCRSARSTSCWWSSLISPDNARDTLFLSNYASINIVDELKRLPGIADVTVFGARDYSMRVWLNPEKMARLGVTTADVAAALRAQNAQYAAGRIGTEPAPPGQSFVYTVTATGRLVEPEEFGDIVVRAPRARRACLRLKDIARIELGALNYDTSNTLDGKPTIGMATFLQPGANALEVAAAGARRAWRSSSAGFPAGRRLRDPVRHHALRRRLDQGSEQDHLRGGAAGAGGGVPVPADLARDADPDDRGAGVADRRLRRPVAGRLHASTRSRCSRWCSRSASWWTTPSWCWRTSSA